MRMSHLFGFVAIAAAAALLPGYRLIAQERASTAPATTKLAPIVGTWRVNFSRPPSRGVALVTFTSDGTSVRTTDKSPVMSPSHGAWQQVGEREFQAVWQAFKFDAGGKYIGNQKAIFRVTVSPDGNSLSGAGIGTSYTLDDRLIEGETAEGPFEGTRISVIEHYTK
jgi:hypothetical protein